MTNRRFSKGSKPILTRFTTPLQAKTFMIIKSHKTWQSSNDKSRQQEPVDRFEPPNQRRKHYSTTKRVLPDSTKCRLNASTHYVLRSQILCKLEPVDHWITWTCSHRLFFRQLI